MTLPVEIIGEQELYKKLDEKFGNKNAKKMMRTVLKKQQEVMVPAFKAATATYMDTGNTNDAGGAGMVRITNNGISATVGFTKHDPERWQLVHLNELGYSPHGVFSGTANATHASDGTVFYRPRGFGKLQDAYDENRERLLAVAQETLKRMLGL